MKRLEAIKKSNKNWFETIDNITIAMKCIVKAFPLVIGGGILVDIVLIFCL